MASTFREGAIGLPKIGGGMGGPAERRGGRRGAGKGAWSGQYLETIRSRLSNKTLQDGNKA